MVRDEEKLWDFLHFIISFSREQVWKSGVYRSALHTDYSNSSATGYRYALFIVLRPAVIQTVVVFTIGFLVSQRLLLATNSAEMRYGLTPSEYTYTYTDGFHSGFSGRIDSCIDGDTCHIRELMFDGIPLPPLFRDKMKLRIKGIDAPEKRQANCAAERCLAKLATYMLEDILHAGNGEMIALDDCSHDKYGGRILCNVATSKGDVSELMVESGLAVAYYGRKKISPWCDDDFFTICSHKDLMYCKICQE
jgi:endonuclease YncB( thermonuclease family)